MNARNHTDICASDGTLRRQSSDSAIHPSRAQAIAGCCGVEFLRLWDAEGSEEDRKESAEVGCLSVADDSGEVIHVVDGTIWGACGRCNSLEILVKMCAVEKIGRIRVEKGNRLSALGSRTDGKLTMAGEDRRL
jgi:hypothetical protein